MKTIIITLLISISSSLSAAAGCSEMLLAQLKSTDSALRLQAMEKLTDCQSDPQQLINQLYVFLKDKDPNLRARAALLLATRVRARDAMQLALTVMLDKNQVCRQAALEIFYEIRGETVPVLQELMQHQETRVVKAALEVLADQGLKAAPALDQLRLLASYAPPQIMESARKALQKLEASAAENADQLREQLKNGRLEQKKQALQLAIMGGDAFQFLLPDAAALLPGNNIELNLLLIEFLSGHGRWAHRYLAALKNALYSPDDQVSLEAEKALLKIFLLDAVNLENISPALNEQLEQNPWKADAAVKKMTVKHSNTKREELQFDKGKPTQAVYVDNDRERIENWIYNEAGQPVTRTLKTAAGRMLETTYYRYQDSQLISQETRDSDEALLEKIEYQRVARNQDHTADQELARKAATIFLEKGEAVQAWVQQRSRFEDPLRPVRTDIRLLDAQGNTLEHRVYLEGDANAGAQNDLFAGERDWLAYKWLFEYSDGNLSTVWLGWDDSTYVAREGHLQYNEQNLLETLTWMTGKQLPLWKIRFSHDDNGRMSRKEKLDENDQSVLVENWNCQLDKAGNWIQLHYSSSDFKNETSRDYDLVREMEYEFQMPDSKSRVQEPKFWESDSDDLQEDLKAPAPGDDLQAPPLPDDLQ